MRLYSPPANLETTVAHWKAQEFLFGLSKTKLRIEVSTVTSRERVTVLLPVLNEANRIDACLAALCQQPEELQEILVVDGGSNDGTQAMVQRLQKIDQRIKFVDASPVDPHWTGKAWGLHQGLQKSSTHSEWILCVDADVTVQPQLVRSLLRHAQRSGVRIFSVATGQRLSGNLEALIHPAMLTTLIYRFGSPGRATKNRHRVQANGQCFFAPRQILLRTEAFRAAQASLCEDITIVRRLAECGEQIGFYESDGLVAVKMYENWRETWNNWPRSLPMRDQYFGWRETIGLLGVLGVQALPMPTLILSALIRLPLPVLIVAGFFLMLRLGVLFGVARAYPNRPWTYWLSPIADLPVILRIIHFAVRRRHRWRGRTYRRGKGGVFEPVG
ncbi:MAG: glycosyltransferase [Candidatus Binatia bacterium]